MIKFIEKGKKEERKGGKGKKEGRKGGRQAGRQAGLILLKVNSFSKLDVLI